MKETVLKSDYEHIYRHTKATEKQRDSRLCLIDDQRDKKTHAAISRRGMHDGSHYLEDIAQQLDSRIEALNN